MLAHLPERIETVGLDCPQCPACGESLDEFPGTEDSQVLEIEVKAYRRLIRRRRYRPTCQCGCVPGIVTAERIQPSVAISKPLDYEYQK